MADEQIHVDLTFGADTSKAKSQIMELKKLLDDVAKSPGRGSSLFDDKEIREASKAAQELEMHLSKAVNVNTGKLDLSRFSSSLKNSKKTLTDYYNQLLKCGPEGQKAFNKLAQSVATAEAPVTRINKHMAEFGRTLKQTMKYQISGSIYRSLVGSIQQAYGYAQDLNESLNNIRIVTGQTTDQMAKFAKEANKAAQELGTTTTAYTNASLIFYQQGLDDKAVKGRTDVVAKMANVTKDSAEDVSSYMTAIWNNFDDGSKSLEHYADVITALGATTASSSAEIAEGLEKFASVGQTIGLSYEYATSALAAVVANTRQSADSVGTAFKTLFSRLQGLQLGKTLEDGVDLNKYSKALNAVGVQILGMNGQLKSADSILDETAEKWKNLDEAQQTALAQTVAGSRQYAQFVALMENWGDVQKNLKTAGSAEGSLQAQQDIYAESWEAASERVKASLQKVYDALIDDDFFIGLNNGLSKFLDGIGTVVEAMGGFNGIATTIGSTLMLIFADRMPGILENLKQNFMVLTGQSQKLMNNIQTETSERISQELANNPNISKSQEIEYTGIQRVIEMKQKLLTASKNMSLADQEEYQRKIENVQAMYEEAAARERQIEQMREELKAEEALIKAKAQKNYLKTFTSDITDIQDTIDARTVEKENLKEERKTINNNLTTYKGQITKATGVEGDWKDENVANQKIAELQRKIDQERKKAEAERRRAEKAETKANEKENIAKDKNKEAKSAQTQANSETKKANNAVKDETKEAHTNNAKQYEKEANAATKVAEKATEAANKKREEAAAYNEAADAAEKNAQELEKLLNHYNEAKSSVEGLDAEIEDLDAAIENDNAELTEKINLLKEFSGEIELTDEDIQKLVEAEGDLSKANITDEKKIALMTKMRAAVSELTKEYNSNIEKSAKLESLNVANQGQIKAYEEETSALEKTSAVTEDLKNRMQGYVNFLKTEVGNTEGFDLTRDAIGEVEKALETEGATVEQVMKAFENLNSTMIVETDKATGKLNEEITQQQGKIENLSGQKIDSFTDKQVALAKATKSTEDSIKNLNSASSETPKTQKEVASSLTKLAGAAMQTVTVVQSLIRLGDIWQDDSKSIGDKLMSTVTVIGMMVPAAMSAATAFKEMGASAWASLGPYAAIAAAIAAIIATVAILYNVVQSKSPEAALERTKKAADGLKSSLDEVNEKLNEVTESFDKYNELKDALDQCTKGTDEWYKALDAVNNEVLLLLDKFPQLAKYVSRDVNGNLTISDAGQEEMTKALEQQQAIVQTALLKTNQSIRKQEADLELQNFTSKSLDSSLSDFGVTSLQSLAMSLIPIVGPMLAFNNQHNGAVASYNDNFNKSYLTAQLQDEGLRRELAGKTDKEISEILKSREGIIGNAVNNAQEQVFNKDFKDAVYAFAEANKGIPLIGELIGNAIKGAVDSIPDSLNESIDDTISSGLGEELRAWKEAVDENTEAIRIQNQEITKNLLQDNKTVQNSKYKDEILKASGDTLQAVYDNIYNSMKDTWGKTGISQADSVNSAVREVWSEYAEAAGLTDARVVDTTGTDDNRTFVYLDENGQRQEKTLEEMQAVVATVRAQEQLSASAEKLDTLFNQLTASGNEFLVDFLANKNLLNSSDENIQSIYDSMNMKNFDELQNYNESGRNAWLSNYVNQAFGGVDGQLSQEELESMGFNSIKELVDKIYEELSDYELAKEDFGKNVYQPIVDSVEEGFKDRKLTIGLKTSVLDVFQDAFENGGRDAMKSVQNVYDKITDTEDIEKFTNVLSSIDWSSTSAKDFSNIISSLGIDIGLTNEELLNFISAMEEVDTSVKNCTESFKSFQDILGNLKDGIIQDDKYQEMIKLNPELANFFTTCLDGSHKLITSVIDFERTINALSLEGFYNNIEKMKAVEDAGFELDDLKNVAADEKINFAYQYGKDKDGSVKVKNMDSFTTIDLDSTNKKQLDAQLAILDTAGYNDKTKLQEWKDKKDIGIGGEGINAQDLQDIAKAVGTVTDGYKNLAEVYGVTQEQIASSATTYKELHAMLDVGIISIEAYTKAAMAMDAEQDLSGLDTEEIKEYSDYLQEAAENIDELNDEMNDIEADIVAKSIMKLNKGIEELSKDFYDASKAEDGWYNTLKKADKSEKQYQDALYDTRSAVASLLDISEQYVSNDFIEQHLEEIKEAASGSEEAIESLRDALKDNVISKIADATNVKVNIDETALREGIDNLQSQLDNMDDLTIGTTIDALDNTDFMNSLNELVQKSGMTVDQVNALFDAMGYEVNYSTEPVPTTIKSPITETTTVVMGTDHIPGAYAGDEGYDVARTRTESHVVGYKTVQGYVDAMAMTSDGSTPQISGITKKADSSFANTPTSSSGGGGGGGGKKKANKEKTTKPKRDPYYKVNRDLEKTGHELTMLQKDEAHVYGKELISNLEQQNKLLQEQVGLYNKKAEIAQKELKTTKSQLSDKNYMKKNFGIKTKVKFDKDGHIDNYNELMAEVNKNKNNEQKRFDKMSAEKQDAYKNKTDAFGKTKLDYYKEWEKDLEELLNQYVSDTDTYYKALEEAKEAHLAAVADNLKKFDQKIQIKVDFRDISIEMNKMIADMSKDFTKAFTLPSTWKEQFNLTKINYDNGRAIFDLRKKEAADFQAEYDKVKSGEYRDFIEASNTNVQDRKDINAQIKKNQDAYKNTKSKKKKKKLRQENEELRAQLADKRAEAKENGYANKIQSVDYYDVSNVKALAASDSEFLEIAIQKNQAVVDAAAELQEYATATWDSYLSAIEEGGQVWDNIADRFDEVNSELDHTAKVIEILQGDTSKTRKNKDKIYEQQLSNYTAKISKETDAYNKAKDALKDIEDTYTKNGENYLIQQDWIAQNNLVKSLHDNLLTDQENIAQLISDIYDNNIQMSIDKFNEDVFGRAYDTVREQYDLLRKQEEEEFDSTERTYQITTLKNQYLKLAEDQKDLKIKQKIAEVMEHQTALLAKQDEINQRDIDIQNKKFALLQAQIALEEAQNNKSSMKLVRDEAGNWTYNYVADQEDVKNKQQDVIDKTYDWYETTKNAKAFEDERALNLISEGNEKLKELYANRNKYTDEEFENLQTNIRKGYFDKADIARNKSSLYSQELGEAAYVLNGEMYEADVKNYEQATEDQKKLMDEAAAHGMGSSESVLNFLAGENGVYSQATQAGMEFCDKTIASFTSWATDSRDNITSVRENWNTMITEMDSSFNEFDKDIKDAKLDEYWNNLDKQIDNTKVDLELVNEQMGMFTDYESSLKDIQADALEMAKSFSEVATQAKEAAQAVKILSGIKAGVKTDENGNYTGEDDDDEVPEGKTELHKIAALSEGESKTKGKYIKVFSDSGTTKTFYKNNPSNKKYIYKDGELEKNDKGYSRYTIFKNRAVGQPIPFDTGGYTGDWDGGDGRLAMLHSKELVLNADDTKNFLEGINAIRDIASFNDSITSSITRGIANMMMKIAGVGQFSMGQTRADSAAAANTFNITAEFPNANSVAEIQEAILSLPTLASQYLAQERIKGL